MHRLHSFSAAFLLCIVVSPMLYAQTVAAYATDPKFISSMAEGRKLALEHHGAFAIDAFKRANKIADGRDALCLMAMLEAQSGMGDYKGAIVTAAALEAMATTPQAKAEAEVSRGMLLYRQAGDKGKPELLHAADEMLKVAMVNDPKNATAHYLDGQVLSRLGQMEDARKQFEACLSCLSPLSDAYIRAKHFAANPSMSTAKMAPPFTVTSLDGTKFNLDAMNGRVVLIDFWATWCGPCNEELPQMRKIAKEFAGQPLVIISVSWDADEAKWKAFIDRKSVV